MSDTPVYSFCNTLMARMALSVSRGSLSYLYMQMYM